MPEGPEVKILVDSLNKYLQHTTIIKLSILSGRYFSDSDRIRKKPDKYQPFIEALPLSIKEIKCKGKFIYFVFGNNWFMYNTLGMSGSWTNTFRKHCHLELHYIDGNGDTKKLWFCDIRRFGTVKFVDNLQDLNNKLNSLGPDLLDENTDLSTFKAVVEKNKTKNITQFLMDQSKISGCGNYIKCESLYLSKISPHLTLRELTDLQIENLFKSLKKVITSSYQQQGATIATYQNMEGQKGGFTNFFKVYGRKLDDNNNAIKKETTKDGRTTHWVPLIQE